MEIELLRFRVWINYSEGFDGLKGNRSLEENVGSVLKESEIVVEV